MYLYSLSDRAAKFFEERRLVAGILAVAAIAGILTLAVVAPNAIQIFSPRYKKKFIYRDQNWKRTMRTIEQRNYLKQTKEKGGVITYTITTSGLKNLLRYNTKMQSPGRWDGKWRLIIFDISEDKRDIRNILRRQLRSLGFEPLQRSVWISPHPLHPDFRKLLHFGAQQEPIELHYLHVYRFEDDQKLLRRFSLS